MHVPIEKEDKKKLVGTHYKNIENNYDLQYYNSDGDIRYIVPYRNNKKEGLSVKLYYSRDKTRLPPRFSEEDITTQVYVLLEEAKAIDISLEAGFYRYILLGLKLPEKIHNYQFYYEMKDSPNEYEKINIMDEILI